MKIFTGEQIRDLDRYTIEHEPIESILLMERAAEAITRAVCEEWSNIHPVIVFAGPGNNGGDALAVARMLCDKEYEVEAYLFNISGHLSPDCAANRDRLVESKRLKAFHEVTDRFDPPLLESGMLVVDGLFGSGINKPLMWGFASLVKYINASPARVVSIDMPSGLMTENNANNICDNIVNADVTLTLQQPKLAFLFAENQRYVGRLKVLDIGISAEGISKTNAPYSIVEEDDIRPMLMRRDAFAHKGTMGNALLIAGSYGMCGAATLAAKACLRSGAGKVTVNTPRRNTAIMQVAVPEAVVQTVLEETMFTETVDTEGFDAVGIGPGIGQAEQTAIAMIAQLRRTQCPLVVDADAINILGNHRAWVQQLPKEIIMTPHPKEYDRLDGPSANSYERLMKASALAQRLQAYIIIKGRFSALCMPDGRVTFNPTGNAGMATAGSGDVLTGIITALLARGYKQQYACQMGMYIHGLAGDLAAEELGEESVIASDIVHYLPQAFKKLNKKT